MIGPVLDATNYEELLTLADRLKYSDDVVDLLTANLYEDHGTITPLEGITFEDLVRELPAGTTD